MRYVCAVTAGALCFLSGHACGSVSVNSIDNSLRLTASHNDERWFQQELQLDTDADFSLAEDWSFNLGTRLRHDEQAELRSESTEFIVREFTLETSALGWQWAIGKQFHNWSQMDNLASFESLSPRDFREFILPDFNQAALGQWMVSGTKSTNAGQWHFIWVPEAEPHELPEQQNWYAFKAPRLRYGFPFSPVQTSVTQLYPEPKKGLYAARYEGFTEQWQWAAQLRYGLDFEPLASNALNSQGQAALALYHQNRLSLVASASTNWGNAVLRGELNLSPGRYLNSNNNGLLQEHKTDQITLALGFDINGFADTFWNLQVLWDEILNAPHNLVRPAKDVLWSMTVRKSFLNDMASTQVRWYGTEQGDGLFRAKGSYLVNDDWQVTLGLDTFYGDNAELFGQYDSQDRVYLQSEWFF